MAGISIWQLLIILLIIVLLFGTKKLSGLGKDLGSAVKGFKDSVKDKEAAAKQEQDNDFPNAVEDKAQARTSEQEQTEKSKQQAD